VNEGEEAVLLLLLAACVCVCEALLLLLAAACCCLLLLAAETALHLASFGTIKWSAEKLARHHAQSATISDSFHKRFQAFSSVFAKC